MNILISLAFLIIIGIAVHFQDKWKAATQALSMERQAWTGMANEHVSARMQAEQARDTANECLRLSRLSVDQLMQERDALRKELKRYKPKRDPETGRWADKT